MKTQRNSRTQKPIRPDQRQKVLSYVFRPPGLISYSIKYQLTYPYSLSLSLFIYIYIYIYHLLQQLSGWRITNKLSYQATNRIVSCLVERLTLHAKLFNSTESVRQGYKVKLNISIAICNRNYAIQFYS